MIDTQILCINSCKGHVFCSTTELHKYPTYVPTLNNISAELLNTYTYVIVYLRDVHVTITQNIVCVEIN